LKRENVHQAINRTSRHYAGTLARPGHAQPGTPEATSPPPTTSRPSGWRASAWPKPRTPDQQAGRKTHRIGESGRPRHNQPASGPPVQSRSGRLRIGSSGWPATSGRIAAAN